MARLIDADKINYHEHTECMGHGDFETVRTVTDKEIAEIPTVYAVEVVRCNDCIYYHRKIGYGFGQCSKCRLMPYPEDFCSYGERKDGYMNG